MNSFWPLSTIYMCRKGQFCYRDGNFHFGAATVECIRRATAPSPALCLVWSLPMSPHLHIQLLGTFHCLLDERPLFLAHKPRQQALVAYLLLHRHAPPTRQQVAFALWPDSSEA